MLTKTSNSVIFAKLVITVSSAVSKFDETTIFVPVCEVLAFHFIRERIISACAWSGFGDGG